MGCAATSDRQAVLASLAARLLAVMDSLAVSLNVGFPETARATVQQIGSVGFQFASIRESDSMSLPSKPEIATRHFRVVVVASG